MNFCGEFIRTLNRKGRVTLPSIFGLKGKYVYFYFTEESMLEVHPSIKDFNQEECRYVYMAEVDQQGRVVIPKKIREKTLPFSCEIRFVGCKNYIKIEHRVV